MFIKPCHGYITSLFGMRYHPIHKENRLHAGVDYGSHANDNIYAVADGVVRSSNYEHSGFGHYIIIDHTINRKRISTAYAHLSKRSVKVGQRVRSGQVIGLKGSTGSSTAKHLHFEVHVGGWVFVGGNKPNAVDPLLYIIDQDIKSLQSDLSKLGYKIKVDGVYGKETIEIVKSYQKKNGLVSDGYAGQVTFNSVKQSVSRVNTASTKPTSPPLINNKEKIRMFNPSNGTLKKEAENMLKIAREMKILSSAEHEQKLKKGELPLDDFTAIVAAVIGRQLEEKREAK